MNYGGVGVVVGHEISHGFDPRGSLYDFEGNFNDTWTPLTRQLYLQRIDCIILAYNNFEVNDGIFVDGNRSITENTADIAGMEETWEAYKNSNTIKNEYDTYILPGFKDFTHDKLFWVTYAHSFCDVWRPDRYEDIPTSAPTYYITHAPRKARVNVVAMNTNGFNEAFNCPINSPMNPENKCHVWIDY